MKPRLIIEQKITAFANKYMVSVANEAGEKAQLVAFAQQKRLAFKEKVTFYTDEQKTSVAFTFRAEKVMDVHGRYFVEDASGQMLGMFKKEFMQSLLNSTWKVIDKDGNEVFIVKESNEVLAALRRFIGWVPFVGGLFEIVLLFIRYHFSFVDPSSQQELGQYKKTTLFRDHYLLSMTDDAIARTDWRVIAAMAVALDALQSR
jgi:uncharacterized protein YxjI